MSETRPTALIIGASGQVGAHCLRSFADRGYRVIGTYASKPRDGLVRLDLSDPASVEEAITSLRPDVCVLSGAMTNVDRCEDEPQRALAINAEAPGRAADACRRVGAKLLYLSTEYVFDGTAGPYAEADAPNPINVYGASKLEGERRVLAASDRHLVARTTVVYSHDPGGMNFAMQLWRRLRAGERMRVPTDQISTPTYAPELAAALARLAGEERGGIAHTVGPDLLARFDFAVRAAELFGLPASLLEPVDTSALGQRAARPLRAGLRLGRKLQDGFSDVPGALARVAARLLGEG
ncbi:MAG: dTDP-4-dehydrorhamnose reductase [Myxococcales bacterium]